MSTAWSVLVAVVPLLSGRGITTIVAVALSFWFNVPSRQVTLLPARLQPAPWLTELESYVTRSGRVLTT